ncbi:MAG: hypothetical protein NTX13_10970 [Acidobacteria bacterium]|nr:hypothetical protein [Acidobacteriota bacterium]
MSLTLAIGVVGVRALDSILFKMRAGEKPKKADTLKFARALHRNKIVDFGDWPEFQPSPAPSLDYIPKGRIGGGNLSKGCYTFWEVFGLAAEDIAKTGRGSFVRAQLARGRTARDVIRDLYGVALPDPGPSGYGHRPELETRTLRRSIQEAEAKVYKGPRPSR